MRAWISARLYAARNKILNMGFCLVYLASKNSQWNWRNYCDYSFNQNVPSYSFPKRWNICIYTISTPKNHGKHYRQTAQTAPTNILIIPHKTKTLSARKWDATREIFIDDMHFEFADWLTGWLAWNSYSFNGVKCMHKINRTVITIQMNYYSNWWKFQTY